MLRNVVVRAVERLGTKLMGSGPGGVGGWNPLPFVGLLALGAVGRCLRSEWVWFWIAALALRALAMTGLALNGVGLFGDGWVEVAPGGVGGFDEAEFGDAGAGFELLFAGDGAVHGIVEFEPD